MSYAYVLNDTIDAVTGRLPLYSHDKTTGDIVKFFPSTPEADLNRCGWFTVVEDPRPDDTATHTSDASYTLVSGVPHRVWTVRPKTQAELDAETHAANRATILANLDQDMARLAAIMAETNATINQNPAARIKDIVQSVRRTIRLAKNDLTGTN